MDDEIALHPPRLAYDSRLGQRHSLAHVLTAAIGMKSRKSVRFEEQHLRDALIGVNLGRERRGVRKSSDMPFHSGSSGDVDDDAAARTSTSRQPSAPSAGYGKLHRACQRKRIRRNDAHVGGNVDKAFGVKLLWIDDGRVDVGKDLELPRTAHVVAVARGCKK